MTTPSLLQASRAALIELVAVQRVISSGDTVVVDEHVIAGLATAIAAAEAEEAALVREYRIVSVDSGRELEGPGGHERAVEGKRFFGSEGRIESRVVTPWAALTEAKESTDA